SVFYDASAVGMSFAVFHEGETVKQEHLGYRDVASKQTADEETRYSINSMTKGLVGVLIGIAHHERKLDYDAPVRTYLPNFRSTNPVVQQHATIIDFLSHRTGIAGNDIYWLGAQNTVYLKKCEALKCFSTLQTIAP